MNDIKHLFAKYQKPIISGLNHWALGTPFRKLLGIDHECKDKITRLTDNSYQTRLGKRKFQSTFRTYPVFAKRMGVALSKWDIIKDYISGNPKIYQGLDEYRGLLAQLGLLNTREFPTVMAASGDPIYSGNGDGFTGKLNANLATARANNSSIADTDGNFSVTYGDFSGTFYVYRPFTPFDLTGLSGVTVTGVNYAARCDIKTTDGTVNVVETTQASTSTLAVTDHANFNTTKFVASDFSGFVNDTNKEVIFDSDGISYVQGVVGSWAKVAFRDALDIAGTSPSGVHTNISFYGSEYAGTDHDPYLEVTYTPALASQAVWF